MADADKLNLIQCSDNTGRYRSVRPMRGAKTRAPKKTTPKFLVLYRKRINTRMMWEQGTLACGNLLPIASTRFRVAGGALAN